MDASLLEVFTYYRDVARNGVTPSEHAALLEAQRDYLPQTRQEADKQKQARLGKHRDKAYVFQRSPEAQKRLEESDCRYRRFKMVQAALGGNLTVKASAPKYEPDAVRRIMPARNRPIDNSVAGMAISAADAKRQHMIEQVRAGNMNNQPTWMDVVECFGSYAALHEAAK